MTESTAIEEGAGAAANPLRWYVVHAYSGMEKAVERNLRERIERAGMHAKFGRILVPTEEVVELKNGKQLIAFGRDSWREVKKVVWPTRKEAIQMTAYVFGFVVIMSIFLWLTDKTLEWVFFDLILGWRK
jgi:preprotein translocase subunit SecE